MKGELSAQEIENSEKMFMKIVQREAFNGKSTGDKLKTLNISLDDDGLIRLKTNIFRLEDDENFVNPIVLPSEHELVKQLIYERHMNLLHRGVQAVLADIRQRVWVLRGRKTIQRVITKCFRCRRYSSKKMETEPAPLPEDRVWDAFVFEVTGGDLAGPLHLKDGSKSWILLFTCAVYRAIHLELIQSLYTNAFLLGLRRFIARRGKPKKTVQR
ncbi:uncharacterized protein LOC118195995 [Stegodyphus dumicola]|uniref:uncharacterized protein LOC118195995 n=1 Tax=Stegodyphus dumicola TaxID=202533 RepID=UPI0015B2D37D|nr:uncharacterized protein LOC118195995 [Stegodyphus dumicola]